MQLKVLPSLRNAQKMRIIYNILWKCIETGQFYRNSIRTCNFLGDWPTFAKTDYCFTTDLKIPLKMFVVIL